MSRKRRGKLPSEPIEIHIESLSHDGRGVGRLDGKTSFVAGGLPGERLSFRLIRRKKNYDEGKVVEVITPSENRVAPQCAHFGTCGGCALQHLDHASQIEFKQQGLLDALTHIGGVTPENLAPPLESNPWGYRRKARLGVKFVRKHERVFAGFRERGSSFLTDVRRCHVLHPKVGDHIGAMADMIGTLSVREKLPQVEMAMGDDLCVMVFRVLEPLTDDDRATLTDFCDRHGWLPYVQEGGPDTVIPLGDKPVELHYTLPAQGVHYSFLPTDFTQVNLDINRHMVTQALDWLKPGADEKILDLFCGLGNFTLPLAKASAAVVGVEGDSGLVARARANAAANALTNVRFFMANLYDTLDAEPWLMETYDGLVLDPPRTGAADCLPLVPKLGVNRILYVSCYPGTLARDAGILVKEQGFRLERAGIMDMFPHTGHVESMALFVRVC